MGTQPKSPRKLVEIRGRSTLLSGWESPPGGFAPKKCSYRLKIEVCMIKVKSRGNETAEQMLRRFKKMCEKEGLTKDIKRVAYYEKPSEKRRRRQRKGPRPTAMTGGGGRSSR
jgi:small subunit ribosomal protein S21